MERQSLAGWYWPVRLETWSFLLLAGLEDPPRPEVPKAIELCRQAGVKVIMVFLCKSPRFSVAASRPFDNRLILWGIALEIGLLGVIVYTPWGNDILGTAPLDAWVWLFVLPFMAAMLALEEGRKWLLRRKGGKAYFSDIGFIRRCRFKPVRWCRCNAPLPHRGSAGAWVP